MKLILKKRKSLAIMINAQLLLLLVILFLRTALYAQTESEQGSERKVDLAPFPVVAYSPDTSVMLGGGLIVFSRPLNQPSANPDSVQLISLYSLKNQLLVATAYKLWLFDDTVYNRGGISYLYWPSEFYGIGANSDESAEEKYVARQVPISQEFMCNVAEHTFIGLIYDFEYFNIIEREDGGMLDRGDIAGSDLTLISAPGVKIEYDTRNSEFYPSRGFYSAMKGSLNAPLFGASEQFTRSSAEHRHFFPLYKDEIIYGAQVKGTIQTGDVPLNKMKGIGGAQVLRGLEETRYIDKCKYSVQHELRYPFYFLPKHPVADRFRGAIFSGLANVAPRADEFKNSSVKWSAGAGIRFALNAEEILNLRFDYAYNSDGNTNSHFVFEEAF